MRQLRFLTLVLSAGVSFGCGTERPSAPDHPSKTSIAKEKIREAGDATVDAAKEQKDEFVRATSRRLDDLTAKLKELEDRAAAAEGDAKAELERKAAAAKVKRDAAVRRLDELKEASADRWEKIKEGVGNALDDLQKAFE